MEAAGEMPAEYCYRNSHKFKKYVVKFRRLLPRIPSYLLIIGLYSYCGFNNIQLLFAQTKLLTDQSLHNEGRWMPEDVNNRAEYKGKIL